MPRVITGSARGVQLRSPKGMKTRPTSDRVKEAVFNIIANRRYDINILDLFSGTGQIGIEALSRGATKAVFIDNQRDSTECIRANLEKTKLTSKALVIQADVFAALSSLPSTPTFDLVYMDPPFAQAMLLFKETSRILITKKLLSPAAIVIIEHSADEMPGDIVTNLKFIRRCKYGTVMLSFYESCKNID